MPRALKVCPCIGCAAHEGSCPELVQAGRCPRCTAAAEQRRGSATERGYGKSHRAFRRAVLRRDPICVLPDCYAPSAHADHYPLSLRELQALDLNPYTPDRGRGLCARHHSSETAKHQPGGWHAR